MKVYLVGGAVRDKLLGLPVAERDWVVVDVTPEQMLADGFVAVGKDFPVFLHPQTKEEYALARTERKSGSGYHGFTFHTGEDVTLEDDLARRDLTVNAMAEDEQGNLIDPHGGREDLENKILRHVSPAFVEDPVRILRLARFYARFAPLGFTVAEETLALIRRMVASGEVDALVPERIWQETRRALDQEAPQLYFELLRECGALAVIFPEVEAMFGVPQKPEHHPEIDCGVHLMMALEQSAELNAPNIVRFAVLCHDFGKGATPKDVLPSHREHESRGVPIVEAFCERLNVPKGYRELAVIVTRFHLHVHMARRLRPGTLLELFEHTDALRRPERFEDFLLACECDARGREGLADRDYDQPDYLRRALAAANSVEAKDALADGFQGAAVGEELRRRRLQALADWRRTS